VVVDPAWPTWLSPVGWGQLIRPFGGNNWEFLLPTFVFIAVLCAAAFALTDRRDLGRGIFSEGRGPANASPGLLSPIGLAWRLQRGAFYGWAASTAVFGFLMGAILGDLEEALGGLDFSDLLLRIGGTDQLLAAYTVAVTSFYGSAISAYTVQVLLRMRIEESDGPLELLLGTRVSRSQWMLSYVVNALLGSLALLVLMGLSIGLGAGLTLGDLGEWLTDLLGAGLVQAPAVLLVGSLVVVAFAFLPRRATAISWAVFIFALLAGPMLGETMRLPDAVMDLSPFTHTPRLPVASFEAAPVAVMMAIAVLLTALGLGRFRRRDLAL
jgi:ABC-2 type transport system permease protein